MSHFTVMVISTKGKKNAEQQLAPYQENNMGDCPQEYMEFVDQEQDFYDDWQSGSAKRMRNKHTGQLLSPYADIFKLPKEGKPFEGDRYGNPYPERYEEVQVPYTELYSTLEAYVNAEECVKRQENDEGELRYGYWSNPNSKWDWYQIGGRWAGMLLLKEGAKRKQEPEPSWGWSPEDLANLKNDKRKADVARKSEIDWEAMMQEGRQKHLNTWDKVAMACGVDDRGHIKQPMWSWEQVVEQCNKNYDQAREVYRQQPEVIAFAECKVGGFMGSVSDFDCTRDEYGERGANDAISTFAVLIDGDWQERGSMGWWGMSSETDEEARAWQNSFYDAYIKNLPDNAMITVVDCHI